MGKKCMLVAHQNHKYSLLCQDLRKIIFRERRDRPPLPSFFKIDIVEKHC